MYLELHQRLFSICLNYVISVLKSTYVLYYIYWFKTLRKDFQEEIRRWEDLSNLQYCRTSVKKNDNGAQSSLPIWYNPYKNLKNILHRSRENNPEIHLEEQKTLTSQTLLNRKSNTGGFSKPNLKLCYRAIVTKLYDTTTNHMGRQMENRIWH